MFVHRNFKGAVGWLVLFVCLVWFTGSAHGVADFDRMLVTITQRWGAGVTPVFNSWRSLIRNVSALPDAERLKRVNDFFNRQIKFGEDTVIWGQDDYWATPLETLGMGAGDCEDFVIAKFFTLREAGVAPEKLRLIYVRAKIGGALQSHMVLAYYAEPEAEPLVLDNLISEIRPASRRPDLTPVYSFNMEGIYSGVAGKNDVKIGTIGRLSRWEDLLKRARAEGFE